MNIFIKNNGLNLIILIVLGTFFGCAALKPISPRIIDTIIIKNSTGEYIQQVSISKDFSSPEAKVGSVSPLPVNAQQVFERPTRAKRLPNTLQIHWITGANRLYKKEISIEALLLSVSVKQHPTLILDFQMNGVVNAYIEN